MIFKAERVCSTPGWLVLSDGASFEAELITSADFDGHQAVHTGEVVFNTSLTGYQEVATDPSYAGQFIVFTNPHIGNYGCNAIDMESAKIWASGVIVRDYSPVYSNYRATMSLLELTQQSGVPLISGVDTRALTRHIRVHGALGAVIGTASLETLTALATSDLTTTGKDLATGAGRRSRLQIAGPGPRVVAIDYGMKSSIITQLSKHFEVVVVPADTPAQDILAEKPKGIFLSNGPGDPAAIDYSDQQILGLLGRVPIFGICLGHQLLARAIGARTYKLEFGHHGGNHPVSRLRDKVVEITSQNHNYAVDEESLLKANSAAKITHLNLNDGVVEGFSLNLEGAFCVQYHPEAGPGPHDSYYLFDEFKDHVIANG